MCAVVPFLSSSDCLSPLSSILQTFSFFYKFCGRMSQFIGKSTDEVGIGLESDGLSDFIDPIPFLKLGVRQELILIKTAMGYSFKVSE